jgi:superfamily I DNA/RNA helicase
MAQGPLDRAGLTAAQREAAAHVDGPMLVIAGPGSGKTRTLTARLCHLIQEGHARPEELLAVTFTRKAAAELRERLLCALGPGAAGAWVGTFHALAARLRVSSVPVPVLDEAGQRALVRRAAAETGADPRRLQRALTLAKAHLAIDSAGAAGAADADIGAGEGDEILRAGLRRYEALRRDLGAEDLDDLLIEAARAQRGRPPPFRYVSVDEYQDGNRVQRDLLRALCGEAGNVFAIGDPDQAIYAFRGADVSHFLAFPGDFPGAKVVALGENFRSSATIVSAAAAVIERNRERRPVVLRPSRPAGAAITELRAAGEVAEAALIAAEIERLVGGTSLHSYDSGRASSHRGGGYSFADIAILSRTVARADVLAEGLGRAGVPLQRPRRQAVAGSEEAADLLAYLRFVERPEDPGALARVLGREAPRCKLAPWAALVAAAAAEQGPGGAAGIREIDELRRALMPLPWVERLQALAARLGTPPEQVEAVRAAAARGEGDGGVGPGHEADELDARAERVSVLTLHGAKGLEFPVVFLAGCEAALLPGREPDPTEVEEERRLFYVGMTRAKDLLYISHAARRGAADPSPFLQEIPAAYLRAPEPPRPRKPKPQMKLF